MCKKTVKLIFYSCIVVFWPSAPSAPSAPSMQFRIADCAYILEHPARCRSHDAYLLRARRRRRFVYLPHEREERVDDEPQRLGATSVPSRRVGRHWQDESICPRRRQLYVHSKQSRTFVRFLNGVRSPERNVHPFTVKCTIWTSSRHPIRGRPASIKRK